ncbi:MAG: hypothetical protein SFT90_02915 [Rickettsiales bacterium]|nr:hypothetical protein [Rickettsiales bacterium]
MSHDHDTKLEKIRARQKRDLKAMVHRQHIEAAEQAREQGYESEGLMNVDPNEGIDQDIAGKLGSMKQEIIQNHHERAKKLGVMRSRIRIGRSKAKARGKALGL